MHVQAWFGGMRCQIRQLEVIQEIGALLLQSQLSEQGYEAGQEAWLHEYVL